jgi:cellulose synthase/poly-beta-1,6-N-acetylglucosamine synthase-like glycosyltransferase
LERLLLANLDQTLQIESPRLTPRKAPLASSLISGGAFLLFAALAAQAFFRDGLGGWAVGLVYIAYDTALLGFTAFHMRAILKSPPPISTSARPSLGVIIAAHNEANALPITIDALMRQIDLPDLIVIADDGSSDGTAALLTERYSLEPHKTLHQAGNPDMLWLSMPHAR